jgi:putative ABC transport system ATP-binding protein
MNAQTMLKVERLTKTYFTAAGPLTVLKDVTLEVAAGDTLAVIGPSGSGKTTLLGLCAGLDEPTTGSVALNGANLGRLSEDERALLRNADVGFVFQNFQLIPTLTAMENVLVPLELRSGLRRNAGEGLASSSAVPGDGLTEARALLERVGLSDRLGHYPLQLSGGEQQRVSLARAFVNRPKILFCDEPTGNLDEETARAMMDLVFKLNREHGTTLVLVTHNPDLARRCSRTIRLRGGAVVDDGKI